jgi:hypothetical protein
MSGQSISELPTLIGDLFRTVDKLNQLFPDRPFTPDGHLVGSIGEVVAAYVYGLSLEKCSNQGFDALTADGRKVEIKLTGGKVVSISSAFDLSAEILLVLQLHRNIGFSEIYNGPFPLKLCAGLKESKRKVVQVSLSRLRQIPVADKALLPCAGRSFEDLNSLFPNLAATIG